MNQHDWLRETIDSLLGNFVTLITGITTGVVSSLLIQRLKKEQAILCWSPLRELDLFKSEVLAEAIRPEWEFGLPLKILVGEESVTSLSLVSIRVENTENRVLFANSLGNKKQKEGSSVMNITIGFGEETTVLTGRFSNDLGAYKNRVKLRRNGANASLDLDYINPKQAIDLDFLVSNYVKGSVSVDIAEPGVLMDRKRDR